MIETRGPANCAFCLKNYCSACPVQRTKGSYEEVASSARHREVLGLPHQATPSGLAQGAAANLFLAGGVGNYRPPPGLLARRQPSRDAMVVLASVGAEERMGGRGASSTARRRVRQQPQTLREAMF